MRMKSVENHLTNVTYCLSSSPRCSLLSILTRCSLQTDKINKCQSSFMSFLLKYNNKIQSQDLRRNSSLTFPLFQWCQLFLQYFFWTYKTTLGRGIGGKGNPCPMFLFGIVGTVLLSTSKHFRSEVEFTDMKWITQWYSS